jgi:hypothetical protein
MLTGILLISVYLSPPLIASARLIGGPEEVATIAEDFIHAPDSRRGRERFNALCKAVGVEGLKRLRLSVHDSIALQAAWREVRVTLAEKQEVGRVRPYVAKLRWFFGFLEGRGRLRIPAWWQDSLLSAEGQNDCLELTLGDKPFYHESGFRHIKTPLDTTLMEEAGSIVLTVGKDQTRVSPALLKWPNLSALGTSSRCYLTTHGNVGYSYPLMCIARDSGRIVWKANVWGHLLDGVVLIGRRSQRVTLVEEGGRILVFGASLEGAHVEAFDAKDGKSLFRWTTAY